MDGSHAPRTNKKKLIVFLNKLDNTLTGFQLGGLPYILTDILKLKIIGIFNLSLEHYIKTVASFELYILYLIDKSIHVSIICIHTVP